MKDLKRVSLLLIFLTALLFSGFTGGQGEKAAPAPQPAKQAAGGNLVTPTHIGRNDAPISITMSLQPHYSMQSSNPVRSKYLKEAYAEWIRKHPDVQVTFQMEAGTGAMGKLLTAVRSGTGPDAAQVDSFVLPRFYDYLQSLGNYFTPYELGDLLPYVKKGMTHDGHIKALWFTTDTRVLYYRKDIVKDPPRTWADVISIGKKIKAQHPDIVPFLYPAGRNEATIICLMPLFWAQGGKLVDSTGKPVFNEGKNREDMLNLFNFLKQTIETGITPKRVTTITSEAQQNKDVAAKRIAMFIGGNWQVSQIKSLVGEAGIKNWDIALLPQKNSNIAATGVGGWTFGVFTKDAKKQAAIVSMLNSVYFSSYGEYGWCSHAGYMPTRVNVYKDYTFYSANPWMKKFVAVMKQGGTPRPGFPIYPTISSELQVAVSSVISGGSSPAKALDTAWENVMEAYKSMK